MQENTGSSTVTQNLAHSTYSDVCVQLVEANGCIHSLDWITGLDYWTQKFLDTAHKRGYADN